MGGGGGRCAAAPGLRSPWAVPRPNVRVHNCLSLLFPRLRLSLHWHFKKRSSQPFSPLSARAMRRSHPPVSLQISLSLSLSPVSFLSHASNNTACSTPHNSLTLHSSPSPPPRASQFLSSTLPPFTMKFAMISFSSAIAVASAGCTYNPGSEYAIDGLPAGQFLHVMNIPAGTRDVTVRLAAPRDLDINLYTAVDQVNPFMTCGHGQQYTNPTISPGGSSVKLCADGCSAQARIPETGAFPNGEVLNIEVTSQSGDELMYIKDVTEALVLKVRSYALCDGVITVAWQGSASCTEQQPATWLGEVTADMQTLLPDTVVAEAQVEAVAAGIATAEPTFECIHSECKRWSCDEWCACWDGTQSLSLPFRLYHIYD